MNSRAKIEGVNKFSRSLDLDDISLSYPECDMQNKCKESGVEAELNVYCLEGYFK
ncbi:MAG: hypothetical protein ACTSWE_05435 [Promethearchaeota archaeon]